MCGYTITRLCPTRLDALAYIKENQVEGEYNMFDYKEHRRSSEKMPIVQAKRKVVHKEDPSIESAILWDNRRKCYFKNMKPRQKSSKYIYGRKMGFITGGIDEAGERFDYMKQMYVDDSEKYRFGLNEVLLEFDENHFVEANKRDMLVYNGGEEVPKEEEPFAIRLYAEGNMDHARGLSLGMESYLSQENKNKSSILPKDRMQGKKVSIKATEFRPITEVEEAYGTSQISDKETLRTRLARSKNMEGSFGGCTGDMIRPVEQDNPRCYDLIQSTFFWNQGYMQAERDAELESVKQNRGIANKKEVRESIYDKYYQSGNAKSYGMMVRFIRNQLNKLKPNGEIRIVVSNADPYERIKTRLTPETIAGQYLDKSLHKNIKIEVRELPKTYPQQLADENLNSVGFKQRETKKMRTVTNSRGDNIITKDSIIIIRKEDNK